MDPFPAFEKMKQLSMLGLCSVGSSVTTAPWAISLQNGKPPLHLNENPHNGETNSAQFFLAVAHARTK
jgi:hypothetical protein